MNKAPRYCIGGIDERTQSKCHLIRFVDKKDLPKCEAGTVLIGSIERNKTFDNARGDKGELSVKTRWENPEREKWLVRNDESQRVFGLRPGKKITAISGTGSITSERTLVPGNPLSLSLSMVPRSLGKKRRNIVFEQIRTNLQLPEGTPALCFRSPGRTCQMLTERLCDRLNLKIYLFALSGAITYGDRIVISQSFSDFKNAIDKSMNSDVLDIDRVFMKPETPYRSDREYRIVWFGHSGKDLNTIEFPLIANYQTADHVILDGFRSSVTCEERDRDRYGRVVAVCRHSGRDIYAWLVREGWALAYRRYSLAYVNEEAAARSARRGIWRGEFVPPWDWRRGARLETRDRQPVTRDRRPAGAASGARGGCNIKGNVSYNSGRRIYHMPADRDYARTQIDPSRGERWFCSESEARAAGWRRARR